MAPKMDSKDVSSDEVTDFVSLAPGPAATAARAKVSKVSSQPKASATVPDPASIETGEIDEPYRATFEQMNRLLAGDTGSDGLTENKDIQKRIKAARKRPLVLEDSDGDEDEDEDEPPLRLKTKRSRKANDGLGSMLQVPQKRVKQMSQTEEATVESEEEEDVEPPPKAKKGVATKSVKKLRSQPVSHDLSESDEFDTGFSPAPATRAPARPARQPSTARSSTSSTSRLAHLRPSAKDFTERKPAKKAAAVDLDTYVDPELLEPAARTASSRRNVHDVRNAPARAPMKRGPTSKMFDASTTKGLGTVSSHTSSKDGSRARMTQGTMPNMGALGDPQEMMRRVQAMSDLAKDIGQADHAKKNKR